MSKTTTIELTNPWTGILVERDVTDITDQTIQGYALDSEVCERVHNADGWETPGEWLAKYVEIVGPETAGVQIIGS